MSGIVQAPGTGVPVRPCPSCHREWGQGVLCQACGQVDGLAVGVRVASPGKRLGAHALDTVLGVVTLYIGWLIWAFIIFGRGQTPAKQLLHMRTVHLANGEVSSWGRTFLREAIAKPIISFAAVFTFGLLLFWLLWDKNKQELWDKMMDTVVVSDPHDQLARGALPPPDRPGIHPPVLQPPASPSPVPPGQAQPPALH